MMPFVLQTSDKQGEIEINTIETILGICGQTEFVTYLYKKLLSFSPIYYDSHQKQDGDTRTTRVL